MEIDGPGDPKNEQTGQGSKTFLFRCVRSTEYPVRSTEYYDRIDLDEYFYGMDVDRKGKGNEDRRKEEAGLDYMYVCVRVFSTPTRGEYIG